MSVNYAVKENKVCSLHMDFAREFVARKFGVLAAEKIYAALPLYTRGKNKGKVKGYITWTKCIKGGWVRTGAYDGDSMRGCGYVMAPGTHHVNIVMEWPNLSADKVNGLDAGNRRDAETEAEWAGRCEMGIQQLLGTYVAPKVVYEEPRHPKAHMPREILTDATGHMLRSYIRDGGNLSALVDPKHPLPPKNLAPSCP
jgi:hypothetical protein